MHFATLLLLLCIAFIGADEQVWTDSNGAKCGSDIPIAVATLPEEVHFDIPECTILMTMDGRVFEPVNGEISGTDVFWAISIGKKSSIP